MNKRLSVIGLCWAVTFACISLTTPVLAEDVSAKAYPSMEENLRQMDTDKDGMVSVHEVRAALEARHGKGYEQSLLADMESSASGRSCSTPFAQNFY
jgi:Ca2+-binding EF-hand superfamily protein